MSHQLAEFVERTHCINCGSIHLKELSSGFYQDDPLRAFIENDPWGESPLPYIENEHWVFVQCKNCKQKFHRRILSPTWMEKCYSEWVSDEAIQKFLASRNLNTWRSNFEKGRKHVLHILRLENLTQKIRDEKPVRILDFGCGYGDFLATCNCFGFDGCGVDFAPDRRSRGRVPIFSDLEALRKWEPTKQKFHAITLFEVLEHLANPLEVLESLSDFIVPNGILVLETPNCMGVTNIKTAEDYRKIHPLSHINGFIPETLNGIAKHAGFVPINRGIAHATYDNKLRVIKTEIQGLVGNLLKATTQQYFRKI